MSEQIPIFPEVFLVEGESKTMKTSVSGEAELALVREGLRVVRDDAGSFFRKVTVASLELLDAAGIESPTQADYDAASSDALAACAPYDTQRTWDLHTGRIHDVVGDVSQARHVQEAGKNWWTDTADRAVAAGADALVLDGRNPRARMRDWLEKYGLGIAAELYCVCDSLVAAERTLKGDGVTNPTAAQIEATQASILRRRAMDRARNELPYVEPVIYVCHEPYMSAEEVLGRATELGEPGLPVAVRLQTHRLDRTAMNESAGRLALAAHRLLQ